MPVDAEQKGIYHNSMFGFSSETPSDLHVCELTQFANDNGISVPLDGSGPLCEDRDAHPMMGVYAGYNAMFARAPDAPPRAVCYESDGRPSASGE